MRLLLDTHALIWWLTDNHRLSTPARAAIADPDNLVMASAASGYEIANSSASADCPAELRRIFRARCVRRAADLLVKRAREV